MSLFIQQSVVEKFNFNGEDVRSIYIHGEGQCSVASDVYKVVGYSRKAGVQAIQQLFPRKYRMRLGEIKIDLQGVLKSEFTQPNTVLLKEPGVYCFLLRCNKAEAEPFMDWVVETVLPREVRKLGQKLEEHHRRTTQLQQAVEDRDNRIQAIEYENAGLQGEIRAKDQQIEASQNIALRLSTLCRIAELVERYVDHCRNPSKDNIVIIVRKHTTPENDKYHNFPYYISRIQRRKRYVKLQWLERHFPDHEVTVKIDNPNSVHAFNRLEDRLRLSKSRKST